jgi:type II secretory pathway predicted ATPase ExeA
MFLDFYHLREQPFGVTPDPRYLYLSPTHREALASLIYGTKCGRGFMAMIAEPGMGKTTLLFSLLERLRNSARTAFLFHTQCNSLELLRHLLCDLGIDTPTQDSVEMHQQLNKLLASEGRGGRQVIAIIDEAQNLSDDVLESIRLLSDFETPSSKLIQIIIAGQPLLGEKLASPPLAQLRQRLSVIAHLEPFTPHETYRYIDHRLSMAGLSDGELFDSEARTLIAEASQGIPRNINNLCFAALSLGSAMGTGCINGSIVREVISDLDVSSVSPGHMIGVVSPPLPKASLRNEPLNVQPDEQKNFAGPEPGRARLRFPSPRRARRPIPLTALRSARSTPVEDGLPGAAQRATQCHTSLRGASAEPAGDLLTTDALSETRKTHWELRAALASGFFIALSYVAVRFLWSPVWANQKLASFGNELEIFDKGARKEIGDVIAGLKGNSGNVVAGQLSVLPTSSPRDMTVGSTSTSSAGEQASVTQPGEMKLGELTVYSSPPGAQITIDGQTRPGWITPHKFLGLPKGNHRVSLSKVGYKARALLARVEIGKALQVRLRLESWSSSEKATWDAGGTLPPPTGKGLLKVETIPSGANIFIDDKSYGPSPIEALLSAGPHTYRAELPGFAQYEKAVGVEDGMMSTHKALLGKLTEDEGGTVRIASEPLGASITIDGVARGISPRSVKLATGRHRLELSLSGYQKFSQYIQVSKDKTILISSTLSSLVSPDRAANSTK